MTDSELIAAMERCDPLTADDFGNGWAFIGRILGRNPDGLRVLVHQVLDTDRGLPRHIALAGGGWRCRELAELRCIGVAITSAERKAQIAQLSTLPIPPEMRRGIATVIYER